MSLVFLIFADTTVRDSFALLVRTRGEEAVSISFPKNDPDPQDRYEWTLREFQRIADAIDSASEQSGPAALRNAIAVLELSDPQLARLSDLNPISEASGSKSALAAMLVLVFPEIHWILVTSVQSDATAFYREVHVTDAAKGLERPLAVHDRGYVALFDPSGLRDQIRRRIRDELGDDRAPLAPAVPVRNCIAAAIDEESAYSYLHAYAAYRFGFRPMWLPLLECLRQF